MIPRLTEKAVERKKREVIILQYGEGNFLRGFAEEMIDIANEKGVMNGSVVLVKPRAGGSLEKFHQQDGLYTLILRGNKNTEPVWESRLIKCVSETVAAHEEYDKYMRFAELASLRCIISNTTEAGIVYSLKEEEGISKSYPGKLTMFLYKRFQYFQGDKEKGLVLLPTELIDHNGKKLKDCVFQYARHKQLEEDFFEWLEKACIFCSTLVDRIVTGYPGDEEEQLWEMLGYEDRLMVAAEPFALWVIEAEADQLERVKEVLPLHKAEQPVIFTEDMEPYKIRKVRVLNGAHSALAPVSLLAGNEEVLQSMEDPLVHGFIHRVIFGEILPVLPISRREAERFASSVLERFQNPYNRHRLVSIMLNSVSKWRNRCLPTLLSYEREYGELPPYITFSLAALFVYLYGQEEAADEEDVILLFAKIKNMDVTAALELYLSEENFHGRDLTKVKGLSEKTKEYVNKIMDMGIREAVRALSEREERG